MLLKKLYLVEQLAQIITQSGVEFADLDIKAPTALKIFKQCESQKQILKLQAYLKKTRSEGKDIVLVILTLPVCGRIPHPAYP